MNGLRYISSKKSIREIIGERSDSQNLDIYEAIAGLYEEIDILSKEGESIKNALDSLREVE